MPGILAIVDDVFFIGKLQGTARQVGVALATMRAADFSVEALQKQHPALVIFDLNTTSASAVELIRRLKAHTETAAIPVLGFYSHVQVELQRAAQEAGCEQVLPRSKFTATLPELLKQYATLG